jgi:hypothetical protein
LKRIYLFRYLFLSVLPQPANTQSAFNANAFRVMSTAERLTHIDDHKKEWKDTSIFLAWYRPAVKVAQSNNDKKVVWALLYEHFHHMRDRHLKQDTLNGLEMNLLEEAKRYGLKQEAIVAQH